MPMHKPERLWAHSIEVFRQHAQKTARTTQAETWVRRMVMTNVVFMICIAAGTTGVLAQQSKARMPLPIGRARFQVESSLPKTADRGAATFFLASLYARLGDS